MEAPQLGDQPTNPPRLEEATFGAGCFWCMESVFNQMRGVVNAESGYCNGDDPAPSYESVCTGRTGHAEVVRVRFNPNEVSFGQLLDVFFTLHDPTTLNRQGNDVGTQYRSGVYTHTPSQAVLARQVIEDLTLNRTYDAPIVTEVTPVVNYHPAEAYHQRYFEQNPNQGYCAFVVAPKVAKFQRTFASLIKPR
jgi:peptide-methionine (S)-S-oxide reductase